MQARQEIFARAYLANNLNATKAAIAAGYSKKGADVVGSRLLGTARVQKLIAKFSQKNAAKLDITAENVLGELRKMGFANMLDYMRAEPDGEFVLDFSNLTREQGAAIQEYTVDATGGTGDGERKQVMRTRFKLADKARSLELLGKYLKLFTEKVEHSGSVGLADVLAEARQRAKDGDST